MKWKDDTDEWKGADKRRAQVRWFGIPLWTGRMRRIVRVWGPFGYVELLRVEGEDRQPGIVTLFKHLPKNKIPNWLMSPYVDDPATGGKTRRCMSQRVWGWIGLSVRKPSADHVQA